MLEELCSICSLFGVFVEAMADKILENRGPFRVLKLGSVLCHNQIQYFLLRLTDIRRLTVGKFKSKNTEGPDVNLDIIRCFSTNQFWGHPANSSHLTVSLRFFLGKLGGISKIGQFQVSSLINQDIIRLDISVNDVSFM